MQITMGAVGTGPTITFSDGKTVDLSRKIRLVKTELSTRGPGLVLEGVLADAPDASTSYGGPMQIHLRFLGDARADWCPELGDTIENVE
jgi:hypothetical protein